VTTSAPDSHMSTRLLTRTCLADGLRLRCDGDRVIIRHQPQLHVHAAQRQAVAQRNLCVVAARSAQ